MTRAAWFHCFSGIAGDMALGALLDAGAPVDAVRDVLGRLPVGGWSLERERVQRGGIRATRAAVRVEVGGAHRRVGDILRMLDGLPAEVAEPARRVFGLLGAVEGRAHGLSAGDVELHEVGSLDAIVDVVGTCAALHLLGVDEVAASPVAVGRGMVRSAHGLLPNPAPATLALLAGCGAPVHGVEVGTELTTPTGAALLAALATGGFGPMPALRVERVGYGAGNADLPDRPNLTQVVIGTAAEPRAAFVSAGQPVVQLEANVDDATGEVLAHTIGALLGGGAHDAWITPIVMKKGRPAHTVHALCDPAVIGPVTEVLVRETGTLGVRALPAERWPLQRAEEVVHVGGQPIRVKVGGHRVKVEHDDAMKAAGILGLPLREVLSRAEAAGWDQSPHDPGAARAADDRAEDRP